MKTIDSNQAGIIGMALDGKLLIGEIVYSAVNACKYKIEKASCPLKGVQAVQKRKSIRYRAVATKDCVRRNLGYFDTPEEAHAAYLRASEELHGEFASDGTRK